MNDPSTPTVWRTRDSSPAFLATFLGLNWQESMARAARYGYTIRESRRDGRAAIVTADVRLDRLNLTFVKDLVTDITIG